jgi:hypothetical protein
MKRVLTYMVLTTLAGSACHPGPAGPGAPGAAAAPADPLALVERRRRDAVASALAKAGGNRPELERALAEIEPEMRRGMAFLVATMPEGDLRTLSTPFLVANVRESYAAWRAAPWGSGIPEDTFFRYILPYANLNEARDEWRADFARRFQAKAFEIGGKSGDPMEAVRWVNDRLNEELKVQFHATRRRAPDQGPYESMSLGYASCTGLSILLADALRACAIPARCVGCPEWTVTPGNHTWVEAWWDRWWNIGDTGSDPRDANWVNERCRSETDGDRPRNAVWAAWWAPTGEHFPVPWDWSIGWIPGRNVTRFYREPVEVKVAIPGVTPEGHAVEADRLPATVLAFWHDELVARDRVERPGEAATLHLARGEPFRLEILFANGERAVRTDFDP